jgi:RimJ/RimL family protein N-acetyltransferase
MHGTLRKFTNDDFDSFERFTRFNDAFKTSYFPERNLSAVESWSRFCQLIGHWQIRDYGWYGFFQPESKTILGIVGAEFSPFLRNPEFTVISSNCANKRLNTWQMLCAYLQTENWRYIEKDTYLRVNKLNTDCKTLLRRFGFKYLTEHQYAENCTAEIWKLDWSLAIDRYNKSQIHSSAGV